MQTRIWVPSPLVGEGQDEGATVTPPRVPLDTLSLALSHQERGENAEGTSPTAREMSFPRSLSPRNRGAGIPTATVGFLLYHRRRIPTVVLSAGQIFPLTSVRFLTLVRALLESTCECGLSVSNRTQITSSRLIIENLWPVHEPHRQGRSCARIGRTHGRKRVGIFCEKFPDYYCTALSDHRPTESSFSRSAHTDLERQFNQ